MFFHLENHNRIWSFFILFNSLDNLTINDLSLIKVYGRYYPGDGPPIPLNTLNFTVSILSKPNNAISLKLEV